MYEHVGTFVGSTWMGVWGGTWMHIFMEAGGGTQVLLLRYCLGWFFF